MTPVSQEYRITGPNLQEVLVVTISLQHPTTEMIHAETLPVEMNRQPAGLNTTTHLAMNPLPEAVKKSNRLDQNGTAATLSHGIRDEADPMETVHPTLPNLADQNTVHPRRAAPNRASVLPLVADPEVPALPLPEDHHHAVDVD